MRVQSVDVESFSSKFVFKTLSVFAWMYPKLNKLVVMTRNILKTKVTALLKYDWKQSIVKISVAVVFENVY